jgi:hypothetical protein
MTDVTAIPKPAWQLKPASTVCGSFDPTLTAALAREFGWKRAFPELQAASISGNKIM